VLELRGQAAVRRHGRPPVVPGLAAVRNAINV
jgi:hypothetical protein